MNGIFLCVFALFAVPSVLAISCFKCTPQGLNEPCTKPTAVVNCDNEEDIGMKYDACIQARFEFAAGDSKIGIMAMQCGVKSMCPTMKEAMCNATAQALKPSGLTLKTCVLDCCQEDKCNDGSEKPTDEGSSIVASFIITITSVVVLLSGFFIH